MRLTKCVRLQLMMTAALALFLPAAILEAAGLERILDEPPLSIPATELVALAGMVPADSVNGIRMIAEETVLRFESNGRVRRTEHTVYRVDGDQDLGDWAQISRDWAPWLEVRPDIRARVVSADGRNHDLDDRTISDNAVPTSNPDVLSDSRLLRGPLPAVGRGSIVEEFHVLQDSALAVGMERQMIVPISRNVPIAVRRVVFEIPDGLPFHYEIEKLSDVRIEKSESNGYHRVSLTATSIPRVHDLELGIPSDTPFLSGIWLSTARGWNGTARSYRAICDRQITEDPDTAAVRRLAASIRESLPAGTGTAGIIEAAVRRLHKDVRYTGVEFGEAAVKPSHPSETVRRHFGDCKDKSILLVALLRDLNVPAELALLLSGPGRDLRPDVAGWGIFDHAIVVVPGTPDVWIDATVEYGRPGMLPAAAQGRWALRVREDVTEVERTPEVISTDNSLLEIREVHLMETGGAMIREMSRPTGNIEAEYRYVYGHAEESATRGALEEYVRQNYATRETARIRTTPGEDFLHSFEMDLEVGGCESVTTDLEKAFVPIPRVSAFSRLPEFLTTFDADSLEIPGYTGRRRSEAQIDDPFVVEIRYRIFPPPGYAPLDLPENTRIDLGSVVYEQKFLADSSGVVTASVRVDSGPKRLTAAMVHEFQVGVKALLEGPALFIGFHHVGLSKLHEGDLVTAARVIRDESLADPKRPAAQIRFTRVLLAAGLGQASRDRAAAIVADNPDVPEALSNLADVLQHDLFGRFRAPGFNRREAIETYRKITARNPEDFTARGNLAILLEHDDSGERYGRQANLEQAIQEYRSIPADKLSEVGLITNLPAALLRAGRINDLEAWATSSERSSTTLIFQAVAASILRGADAGLRIFQGVESGDRATLYSQVGAILILSRHYAEAGAFLKAAAAGRPDASRLLAQAAQFSAMQRFDPANADPMNPRLFPARMLDAYLNVGTGLEPLFSLFPAELRSELKKTDLDSLQQVSRLLRRTFDSMGVPQDVLLDMSASMFQMNVEGDSAFGYRLRGVESTPGASPWAKLYLRPEEQGLVAIALMGDEIGQISAAGIAALRACERGDTAAAHRWLTWASDDIGKSTSTDDSLAVIPFRAFWPPRAPVSSRMRLAALSLTPQTHGREILAIRAEAESLSALESLALEVMRAEAFASEHRYDDLLEHGKRLAARFPDTERPFIYQMEALNHLGRAEEATSLTESRLARHPDDVDALRFQMALGSLRRRYDDVGKAFKRLEERNELSAGDRNNYAWTEFISGRSSENTLENINKAILADSSPSYAILHTQACVYAELGRVVEARDILFQAMDLRGIIEPDSGCRLVLARIAEQLGFREEARNNYLTVEPNVTSFGLRDALEDYVQNRLKVVAP